MSETDQGDQPFTHADAEDILASHARLNAQLEELRPELGRLTTRLDNIKLKAEAAEKVASTNGKVVRLLTVTTVLVVCLTVGSMLAIRAAREQTSQAQESADQTAIAISEIERARDEARLVTCLQHNDVLDAIEIKIVAAGSAAILTLVPGATSPDELPPDLRAAYDNYRAALANDDSLSERRRDCTPEGIAAYYEQRPSPTSTVVD